MRRTGMITEMVGKQFLRLQFGISWGEVSPSLYTGLRPVCRYPLDVDIRRSACSLQCLCILQLSRQCGAPGASELANRLGASTGLSHPEYFKTFFALVASYHTTFCIYFSEAPDIWHR